MRAACYPYQNVLSKPAWTHLEVKRAILSVSLIFPLFPVVTKLEEFFLHCLGIYRKLLFSLFLVSEGKYKDVECI